MKKIIGIVLTTTALTLTVSSSGHRSFTSHVLLPPASLAIGVVGQPYTERLKENGGVGPYIWSLAQGSNLPAGLTLDAATGVISGNPTQPGVATVVSQVSDSSSPALTATESYTLKISPEPFAFHSTMLASVKAGQPYAQQLVANGGTPPYSWSVSSGALPDGIELNASTGMLTGTPTGAMSRFTIQVEDSSGETVLGWQRALAWAKRVVNSDEVMHY